MSPTLLRAVGRALLPAVVLALAVGCGSQAAPGGQPAGQGGPAGPKVDRVVFATTPPRLDSPDVYAQSGPDLWPWRVMYEFMVGLDAKTGQFTPQLATSWKVEPDGQSVRFQLRKDVKFHDGATLTAKDLTPTWQARIREEVKNSPSIYWRTVVKSIETVNDNEAVYHLTRPDGNFMNSISEQRGIMEIFSKADYDKNGLPAAGKAPMAGTGPYAFNAQTAGASLSFKRNATYWGAQPDFPEFEWRWVKEASTRMAALLAGEAHLASLPVDLLAQVQQQNMKVVPGNVLGLRTFMSFYCCYANDPKDASKGWMYPDVPLMDARVRQALSKAIDRDALNKAFFAGKAKTMVLNHYLPDRPGWNPDWEKRFPDQYGYDQAKARQLLVDAGFGPGNPMKTGVFLVPASGYAGAEDLAEAIAANWKSVGVQAELQQVDPASISEATRQFKYNNNLIINSTSSDQSTGATNYGSTLGIRGSGYELIAADRYVNDASNTLDEKKQDELWRAAGNQWFDNFHTIPLFWLPTEVAVNPKFVSDYAFPGSITGTWTHTANIKAAK